MVSCPFAKFGHAQGTDRSPSLRLRVGDPVRYFCFACKVRGELSEFVEEIAQIQRRPELRELAAEIHRKDKVDMGKLIANQNKMWYALEKKEGFDLSQFDEVDAVSGYLVERNISVEMAKHYSMKYDPRQKMFVFPVWREKWLGAEGRFIKRDVKRQTRYNHLNPTGCLGGWQFQDGDSVIVVEGFFDLLNIHCWTEADVYCLNGSVFSETHFHMLESLAKPIYLLLDNDVAGQKCLFTALKKPWRVQVVPLDYGTELDGKDPGCLSQEQFLQICERSGM